jgi:signal transduction histidine kinase
MVLIYASFFCLVILLLAFIINRFAGKLFSGLITDNIAVESQKIAGSISGLYNPWTSSFDIYTVEAMGMYFVHEGYILSVEDIEGNMIWDARSCDMEQCAEVINEISVRMEQDHRMNGALQVSKYPLVSLSRDVGYVNISTYGPYFYSREESGFLRTLNRFLILAGILFILLNMVVSVFLATALSRPILRAADAAKHIAGGDLAVRVPNERGIRELHELSRSVNELAESLENGERWQKRLSSDIAHELRTPLTCLQGNMEAMIDGVWEPTQERLSSCYEEIGRLNKLVEDLSRLSILERENLVLRRTQFDLEKLLKAAAEQFVPAAREKGIRITVNVHPSPAPFYGDYDRLTQIFINLISNAVKYTDSGAVTITAVPEAGGDHYAITVTDTGIGMEREELKHIFDRFYRTDRSRSRGTGGAGIGLSIAKTITEAHGGVISVESEIGKGSAFTVTV